MLGPTSSCTGLLLMFCCCCIFIFLYKYKRERTSAREREKESINKYISNIKNKTSSTYNSTNAYKHARISEPYRTSSPNNNNNNGKQIGQGTHTQLIPSTKQNISEPGQQQPKRWTKRSDLVFRCACNREREEMTLCSYYTVRDGPEVRKNLKWNVSERTNNKENKKSK